MLFSSFQYMLVFLPAVVLICIALRKAGGARAAQALVLAASLLFYAWWKPANLGYLVASILVNWLIAIHMAKRSEQAQRRPWLIAGLVLNIGFLCFFKYTNFLLASFGFGMDRRFHLPALSLPLGISFFTLTQIMYLLDCYEGLLQPLGLFDYTTFVSFFPAVISGPISRAKRIAHQFDQFGGSSETRSALLSQGLYLFTLGLSKKVVFADAFASITNLGFASGVKYSALEAWTFSIAYTLQIYFDFSGYSDMAIGSAKMLGIELPRNFDAPLRSKSIIEFWQRWHITLSQFITTYLYTPILRSFSRATLVKASIATLLSMTIAGLWHGPSWTFVLFGAMHGVGLVVNQYWRKKKMPKLPASASWLATFLLVVVAFIFFRSGTVHDGMEMLRSLVDPHNPLRAVTLQAARSSFTARLGVSLLLGTFLAFFGKDSNQLAREFQPSYRSSFAVAGMVVLSWMALTFNTTQEFVYFKF